MKNLIILFLTTLSTIVFAQKKQLNYYLPESVTYDKNVPTPEDFFGFQIGEQHLSHDQIVSYVRELDRVSERISLAMIGRTYEFRPILLLTITSVDNHKNLESIRREHVKLTDPSVSASVETANMPIVVYQGHSIHGNEPSGANAGVLAAYFWAAAQGKEIDETLQNVVILFDPAFNPDGLQRFSQWVNMHRSKNLVSDPASREFSEIWPYGRTNHYWFDLNRDWLVSQMPESQARIKMYHEWKPNILTDHHEMGSNGTFFFQPGVPSRVNPFTPPKNQELTGRIAEFHARALNRIGSQYYTKQGFDDFYYGKGSTYPDVNGAVGILFEQASSRGHAQRTANGVLTFPFTIRNQLTTSLSTVEAARFLRVEMLNYQRDFFKNAAVEAAKDTKKAYVFGEKYDRSRLNSFVDMLRRNQIKVYELAQNYKDYAKESAYIVPLEQPQYKLIRANFERYTEGVNGFFSDSIFYDISAWTLPLAFNINHSVVENSGFSLNLLGKEITENSVMKGEIVGGKSDYGYAFEWDDYLAPLLLNAALSENLQAKLANAPFKIGANNFNYGTVFIPVQNQGKSSEAIYNLLEKAVKKTNVKVYALQTGLATEGVDLGSPSVVNIKKPNLALFVGEGVSNNDAGEVWHLLDTRYDMQTVQIDVANMSRAKLDNYSCVVMVDGTYSPATAAKLRDYLLGGGTVAAFGRAVKFLKNNDLCNVELKSFSSKSASTKEKKARRAYDKFDDDEGAQVIGGAIFDTEADLTHPLMYGYRINKLPVFRGDTMFMELPQNVYAAPLRYTANPLISGYLNAQNKELAKSSASIIVSSVGSGRVIASIENPNFRAFWYGTNKIMANMILFGNLIQTGTTEGKR
ncbi:MAG: M14 metallopeptidase family protein [Saprospiraceae bacterium]|nr:M14 metallopeptidase family protein [Saprospiraceae bacterium]